MNTWFFSLFLVLGTFISSGNASARYEEVLRDFQNGKLYRASEKLDQHDSSETKFVNLEVQVQLAKCRQGVLNHQWSEVVSECKKTLSLIKVKDPLHARKHLNDWLETLYFEAYALENIQKKESIKRYSVLRKVFAGQIDTRNVYTRSSKRLRKLK